MVASEPRVATVRPPVVEYSREFQAGAAEELRLLPDGSAIVQMLADYSVMQDQARACEEHSPVGRSARSSRCRAFWSREGNRPSGQDRRASSLPIST